MLGLNEGAGRKTGSFRLHVLFQFMGKRIKPKYAPEPLGLTEYYKKRNKVLIWHDKGGLGDVFMHRMVLEDIKRSAPDCDIVFACLPEYADAVRDHPDISEVIDSRTVDPRNYVAYYNTCVTVADRFENYEAPNCKHHRSDIWASVLGIQLTKHDMRFNFVPDRKAVERMERLRRPGTPLVALAPTSKMSTKTLLPWQLEAIVEATRDCSLVGIHNREVKELTGLGIHGLYESTILEWMAYINTADYVISVDTAAFHLAGGLNKPLMGIFTFADGKVYGKYFDFILVQKHKDDGNWDCGPCFKFIDCPKCKDLPKPCLTEITKEMLQDGVKKMFQRWPYNKIASSNT